MGRDCDSGAAAGSVFCVGLFHAPTHTRHACHEVFHPAAGKGELWSHRCLASSPYYSVHQPCILKRSVASTSALVMPGSRTEWPASPTTINSASGHARWSFHALIIGQTTSYRP